MKTAIQLKSEIMYGRKSAARCGRHGRTALFSVAIHSLADPERRPETAQICGVCLADLKTGPLGLELERGRRDKMADDAAWSGTRRIPLVRRQADTRARAIYDALREIEPAWQSVIAQHLDGLPTHTLSNVLHWRRKMFRRTDDGWVTIPGARP